MFAAESFPRLRPRHLVQVRLIDLLPILNSGSLILPNSLSLCILGVIEPYNPRDPNLRVSAGGSSVGPQLSSLTLAAKLNSPLPAAVQVGLLPDPSDRTTKRGNPSHSPTTSSQSARRFGISLSARPNRPTSRTHWRN